MCVIEYFKCENFLFILLMQAFVHEEQDHWHISDLTKCINQYGTSQSSESTTEEIPSVESPKHSTAPPPRLSYLSDEAVKIYLTDLAMRPK